MMDRSMWSLSRRVSWYQRDSRAQQERYRVYSVCGHRSKVNTREQFTDVEASRLHSLGDQIVIRVDC
jgi:hypothetical protein